MIAFVTVDDINFSEARVAIRGRVQCFAPGLVL